MKHSLSLFFSSSPTPFISPSEPLWQPQRHENLCANKGLVVNRGQRHWSGAHLFRRPPDGQLRLASAKLHRNQLVAIFNYNTWAALALQPRPWEASRCTWWRVGGDGGGAGAHWCPLVTMDEAWHVIWRGVWGRCFVNLLSRCFFFVPFQTGKKKQNKTATTTTTELPAVHRANDREHRGPPTLELSRVIYVQNALLKKKK